MNDLQCRQSHRHQLVQFIQEQWQPGPTASDHSTHEFHFQSNDTAPSRLVDLDHLLTIFPNVLQLIEPVAHDCFHHQQQRTPFVIFGLCLDTCHSIGFRSSFSRDSFSQQRTRCTPPHLRSPIRNCRMVRASFVLLMSLDKQWHMGDEMSLLGDRVHFLAFYVQLCHIQLRDFSFTVLTISNEIGETFHN